MAERAPLDARLELAGAWLDLAAALLLTAGCRRVSPVGDLWIDPTDPRTPEPLGRVLARVRADAGSLTEGLARLLTAHETEQVRLAGWACGPVVRCTGDRVLKLSAAAALARAEALEEERRAVGVVAREDGPRVVREGFDQRHEGGHDDCNDLHVHDAGVATGAHAAAKGGAR